MALVAAIIFGNQLTAKYLPQSGPSIILDPCAGWGGRLVGSLLVPRSGDVTYIGIDPERRNSIAYDGLTDRIINELSDELWGPRHTQFFYEPVEDWICSDEADALIGTVDLVMTSPPYGMAEIYNSENPLQSCNRYPTYKEWRTGFLTTLIEGAYDLLKPGGHFVLNIANVKEAPSLESDSLSIASDTGFVLCEQYELAMGRTPGTRKGKSRTVRYDGVVYKSEPVFCFRKPIPPDLTFHAGAKPSIAPNIN